MIFWVHYVTSNRLRVSVSLSQAQTFCIARRATLGCLTNLKLSLSNSFLLKCSKCKYFSEYLGEFIMN